MTVVLDYGINNLRSVQKAIEFLGFKCSIQSDLADCTQLIIPGVGAFKTAMEKLAPIAPTIRDFALAGNPVLGICLGQQLLFDLSEEFGECRGLGLVPGKVEYIRQDAGLKIPHIGWSEVQFKPDSSLGKDFANPQQFYFVHSLVTRCDDPNDIAGTSIYGVEFASSIQRGSVFGTQFHPEKSGAAGLQILRRFLECT